MKKASDTLNIHALVPFSRANGPGNRLVVWVQGCSRRCPGCFNPETHSHDPYCLMKVGEVFFRIVEASSRIEGITISGGEPMEQADALGSLLHRVRSETSLSVVFFSGYTLKQIEKTERGAMLLEDIDILIDGPYIERYRSAQVLKGSSNQRLHLLTDRYHKGDIDDTPTLEMQIDLNGKIHITGVEGINKKNLLSEIGNREVNGSKDL